MFQELNIRALKIVNSKYAKYFAVPIGIALNFLCADLSRSVFQLPLFMDNIWTFVVSALYGPVGCVVGFGYNVLHSFIYANIGSHWAFGFVSLFNAVATIIFFKKGSMNSVFSIFLFWMFVIAGNSILGSIISSMILGSNTVYHAPIDVIVRLLISANDNVFQAKFISRVLINIIDKGFAIFIMFGIYKWAKQDYILDSENK